MHVGKSQCRKRMHHFAVVFFLRRTQLDSVLSVNIIQLLVSSIFLFKGMQLANISFVVKLMRLARLVLHILYVLHDFDANSVCFGALATLGQFCAMQRNLKSVLTSIGKIMFYFELV